MFMYICVIFHVGETFCALTLGTVTPGFAGYTHTHAQVCECMEYTCMRIHEKYACDTDTQLASYQPLGNSEHTGQLRQ